MDGFFSRLLDTSDFPARWSCGNWSPGLGWTHIIADGVIFASYAAIPSTLAVLLVRRRDFPFPKLLLLFVLFILSCGTTHLVEAVIFYEPVYRLSGLLKVITAVVSAATAVVLVVLLPKILGLRLVMQSNVALTREVQAGKQREEQLSTARAELERRSAEATVSRRRVTEALSAARAVACRWVLETGEIEWEVGLRPSARAAGHDVSEGSRTWSEVVGPVQANAIRDLARAAADGAGTMEFESPLHAPGPRIRLAATAEPAVRDQPRALSGMFRFL